MTPAAQAVARMKNRAAVIEIERCKIAGSMRAIRDVAGLGGVQTVVVAEFRRLAGDDPDRTRREGWCA